MRHFEAQFKIPQGLTGRGAWPPQGDLARRYSLPSNEIDVGRMLEEFRGGIEARSETLTRRLAESPLWGDGMSLKSIPDLDTRFEPFTGAARLESIPPAYEHFYGIPGRLHLRENKTTVAEIRGARFYANVDAAKPTPVEKNKSMLEDWRDAVEVMKSAPVPEAGDTDSFLARVGVLDYMKQHALVAFHALTYPERLGSRLEVAGYGELRSKAYNLARDAVRSYYMTILGRPDVDPGAYEKRLADFTEITAALDQSAIHRYYKAAEIDHPITILTNADAASDSHPDTEVIVALPSGGTQIGFAMELASEIKQGAGPRVIMLPLSTHSHIQTLSNRATGEELERMLVEEGVQGKRVTVADDNSNSGNSIQIVVDMLERAGAGSINVNLAELDPLRVIYKHTQDEIPDTVANMNHADYDSVAGIVPITRGNELPLQVRKLYSQFLLRKHYERMQPELGFEVRPHPFERSISGKFPYLFTSSENKAKAGHRFGLRVFNGNTEAVDQAEAAFDALHGGTDGIIPSSEAGQYMRGVALAKLDGVCSYLAREGDNIASKDAYAYAREAAIPPSIAITDTNLLLGGMLLKKPATPEAVQNIFRAYEEAREQGSDVQYITHIGRLDIGKESVERSMYQVSLSVGRIRPDADLEKIRHLLETKPNRVGGIGSFQELMDILAPQPMILEVTKWTEGGTDQFEQQNSSRYELPAEKMTPDIMSMLTRGFVPNH